MVALPTASKPRKPARCSTTSRSSDGARFPRPARRRVAAASCRQPSARSAVLFFVVGSERVLERLHVVGARQRPLVLEPQRARDGGVGLLRGGHDRLGAVAVDAAHRDDADVVADQPAAHRERLQVADHAAQLFVLARQAVVLALDPVRLRLHRVEPVVERVDDAAVDDARADHHPEGEGEEDRDERHDVETEVDHQPEKRSFRVTQRPRANTWMGSATMPTTTIATRAAVTSRTTSRRRTRPS